MEKKEIKQILISILVGACVAFLQVFFAAAGRFLAQYADSIAAGGAASMAYLAQKITQKH